MPARLAHKAGDFLRNNALVTGVLDSETGEELVPCLCWCGAHSTLITYRWAREGLTYPCKHDGCAELGASVLEARNR